MRQIVFGLVMCMAVAGVTMAQAPPVVLTPGSPSMLNAFTPIAGTTSSSPALKQSTTGLRLRLADDSADTFLIASQFQSSTNYVLNQMVMSNTVPTISSGFGTSPAILSSNGTSSFRVNVGTGGVATSGVVGLPAATSGWNCQVVDLTNNTVTRETASTTTTVTVTAAAAWAASDTLIFNCAAY